MSKLKAFAAALVAVTLAAIGTAAWGSSFQANTPTTYAPLGPIVQYSPQGGSSRTSHHGDALGRSSTADVTFSTPAGKGRYDALVSVTAQYHTVGHGSFYITLAALGDRDRPAAYPTRRLVAASKQDSSTTLQFWVRGLAAGRKYSVRPDVDGPSAASSYISLYRVLTRIDLVPAG